MFFNRYNFDLKNFVSKTDVRPEISGVFLTPSHSVATDSFKLMKVESVKGFKLEDYPVIPDRKPMANFQPFILPIDSAEKVIKALPKPNPTFPILDNVVVVKSNKEGVELGSTDLDSWNGTTSRVIDGKFPEYQKLLGDDGRHIEVAVNVKYLKQIVDFYSKFINKPTGEIFIEVPIKMDKPVKFVGLREVGNSESQKATSILMPIKL